jgi:hypothetical protein
MRTLTSIAAVAAAGVVLSAGFLTPAPARGSAVGSCYEIDYTVYHEPGGCVQETTNYSESGVQIWNDPANPTTVEGTGAAGGAFKSMDFRSVGTFTPCDNGVQSADWYWGTDYATHVSGWVLDCYLSGEPS